MAILTSHLIAVELEVFRGVAPSNLLPGLDLLRVDLDEAKVVPAVPGMAHGLEGIAKVDVARLQLGTDAADNVGVA